MIYPFEQLNLLSTKGELEELVNSITQSISALYNIKATPEQVLEHFFLVTQINELKEFSRNNKIDLSDRDQLQSFLTALKTHLEQLPTMEITLAYSPMAADLEIINQWLEANLKLKPLLEISVNPDLIGGCQLNINGYFKDYSLAKRLQEL